MMAPEGWSATFSTCRVWGRKRGSGRGGKEEGGKKREERKRGSGREGTEDGGERKEEEGGGGK
jgi:hypothetical protein